MDKSIVVLGVSIDTETPPSKKEFIKLALVSSELINDINAVSRIEKEMKKVGLFKEDNNGLHTAPTIKIQKSKSKK